MRSLHSRRLLAVALPLALLATACGGRYSDAERLEAAGQVAPAGPADTVAAAAPAAGDVAVAPEAAAGAVPAAGAATPTAAPAGGTAAAKPAAASTATATDRTGTGPSLAGAAGGTAASAAAGPTGTAAAAGPAPAAGAGSGTAQAAASGPKPPIKLGVLGVRSGAVGGIFIPVYEGAVAWAGDVNRRGGLAGHPVQLIVADDGDDPRKAVALAKRMVESDGVTAFYATHMFSTLDAVLPYFEEKGIPVVGSTMSNVGRERSPMFFNTSISARSGLMWNHLLPLMIQRPEIKDVAIFYCAEAEVCRSVNGAFQEIAPQHGYRIRYTAQVSIAQPDYTAEVIAARSAGAQALLLMMDNNSGVRIIGSAHRQGYEPVFAMQATAHAEKFLRDGGKEVEGLLLGGLGRHWTSPLHDDMRAAYKAFVPNGLGLSSSTVVTWNSGRLLEKVAPTWPADPTPADVVASLRALTNETLGGLTAPRTFRPGDLSGTLCASVYRIENGDFVPFQGRDDFHCPPGAA
jgi:branched-chain amino acid transport system substrate-binding protein